MRSRKEMMLSLGAEAGACMTSWRKESYCWYCALKSSSYEGGSRLILCCRFGLGQVSNVVNEEFSALAGTHRSASTFSSAPSFRLTMFTYYRLVLVTALKRQKKSSRSPFSACATAALSVRACHGTLPIRLSMGVVSYLQGMNSVASLTKTKVSWQIRRL